MTLRLAKALDCTRTQRFDTSPLRPLSSLRNAYRLQDHREIKSRLDELFTQKSAVGFLCSVDDAFLCIGPQQDGIVVCSDGTIIDETTRFHGDVVSRLGELDHVRRRATDLDHDLVVTIDAGWRGYYHWLCIALAKAGAVDRLLTDDEVFAFPTFQSDVPVHEGYSQTVHEQSVLKMHLSHDVLYLAPGIYRAPKIKIVWTNFDQIAYFSLLRSFYHRFEACSCEASRGGERKIHIARRANPRLQQDEADRIGEVLCSRGFETIDLESLDFDQQVDMFANARQIVGAHGAGLSNMVFAPRGASVLELNHDMDQRGFLRPYFALVSDGCGHAYRYLNGSAGDFTERRLHEALDRMDLD